MIGAIIESGLLERIAVVTAVLVVLACASVLIVWCIEALSEGRSRRRSRVRGDAAP